MTNRINFTDAQMLNEKLNEFSVQLNNLQRLIETDGYLVAAKYPTTHLPKQTQGTISNIQNIRTKIKSVQTLLHSREKMTKIQPKLDVLTPKLHKCIKTTTTYTNDIMSLQSADTHTNAYADTLQHVYNDVLIAFKEL